MDSVESIHDYTSLELTFLEFLKAKKTLSLIKMKRNLKKIVIRNMVAPIEDFKEHTISFPDVHVKTDEKNSPISFEYSPKFLKY